MKPSGVKRVLLKAIPEHFPVMLVGQPGVGKSDIVEAVAKELGADIILEHPAVADPTDAKGLPFPTADGADFLPFGTLKQLINADKLTICFIDDMGQGAPLVLAGYMQWILARRINGHKISPFVSFVAATNDRTHKAGVQGILEPVKSRFSTIVKLEVDLDDWVSWALQHDILTEFIAFARFRPECLSGFEPTADMKNSCTPRTLAQASRLYAQGIDPRDEFEVLAGAIGERWATELVAFLKVFRKLPNPDAVLMHPDTADVPTDPATLYAISTALARKASEQTMERIVTYADRLPPEFSVLMVRDSVKQCPQVVNTRAFIAWSSKNSEVLI